jgi:hypothetical protein
MKHTVSVRRIWYAAVDLNTQVLIEKLMGSGCSEKFDKGRRYLFPPSSAKFLDIVLQKLLQARCPNASQCVVFYVRSVSERSAALQGPTHLDRCKYTEVPTARRGTAPG